MVAGTVNIPLQKNYSLLYSICCIVTNEVEYVAMQDSFMAHGFRERCEYLVADNTAGNSFNAYEAIRRFFQEAKGEYLVIVHQDVRCMDQLAVLTEKLHQLQQKDASWAVCGNAGGNGYKNFFFHLDDNGRTRKSNGLPARVTSLDENMLIIKSSAGLSISADIGDFHFYGTDICQVADFLGYRSYVIAFMVKHLSSGNLEKMYAQQPAFIEQYGHKLRHRFIQTSCTKFYLSHSKNKNRFYNNGFIFFWVKAFNRMFK